MIADVYVDLIEKVGNLAERIQTKYPRSIFIVLFFVFVYIIVLLFIFSIIFAHLEFCLRKPVYRHSYSLENQQKINLDDLLNSNIGYYWIPSWYYVPEFPFIEFDKKNPRSIHFIWKNDALLFKLIYL